jgi:hypothetical protein
MNWSQAAMRGQDSPGPLVVRRTLGISGGAKIALAATGCNAASGTDMANISRDQVLYGREYQWHDRTQIDQAIRQRMEDHHTERHADQVLLVLQIGIHGQERLDSALCFSQ